MHSVTHETAEFRWLPGEVRGAMERSPALPVETARGLVGNVYDEAGRDDGHGLPWPWASGARDLQDDEPVAGAPTEDDETRVEAVRAQVMAARIGAVTLRPFPESPRHPALKWAAAAATGLGTVLTASGDFAFPLADPPPLLLVLVACLVLVGFDGAVGRLTRAR